MITKVGEPPVIFDSTLLRTSSALMSNYLETKGYLFPEVTYSYKVKRKRATAKYFVVTGPLYTIDSVFFPTDSSLLAWIVRGSMAKTLLKKGNAFDADMLGKEQARVQRNFQNTGYIYFRKEFIHFYADTTIGDHRVDVYVKVDQADSLPEQQIYTIKNIYVYSNFNPQNESKEIKYDTIYYDGIYFLSTKNFLDPDVLATAVFLSKDQMYSRSNYECTLHRISDLGVYKFANVRFVKADTNGVHNFLNCNMYLQPSKKHTIGGSVDVGNVESNFASGIKLSFGSKNVNNRANRIDVSATAGVQIPVFNADSLFYSFNLQLNYSIPKFAFPFIHPQISCYNNPVTKIGLSTSLFQQVNLYSLSNYGISYSMEWKEVDYPLKKYIFPIIGISYVFPTYTQEFADRLESDPFLKESFSEQLIPSLGGAFVFSNQRFDRKSNFTYLRINGEIAGNLFYLFKRATNSNSDSTSGYDFLGIEFSQYVRYEIDLRRYLQFTKNRALVLRFNQGIAVPYLNSNVVPYVKQFYVGGTSSLRAWRVRSLGPGSYNDTSNYYNSSGDLKAEANVEYRFNILGKLKGAAFVDAGNIWILKDDPQKPGGVFKFNEFYNQIAVGTGLGARLDFTYFIMRFDLAAKVYDPVLEKGQRFVLDDFDLFSKTNGVLFQLAVGYPF